MPGYASATVIASEFKGTTFGATGAVTDTELDLWSDEFSRLIDAIISKNYQTPITGVSSLKIMSLIVKSLVAARVYRIINATSGIGESELNKATALEKMAWDWINKLMKGDAILPDALSLSNQSPASYQQENAIDPVWEKEVDQW